METKNIINIPEGFEIDREQSTERKIVLRKIEEKRARSWKEYCEMMKDKDSYIVDMSSNVRTSKFLSAPVVGEFEDKEDAVTFAAFSKLLSLRKNWVGYWKPDWKNNNVAKFTIITAENEISKGEHYKVNSSMSFPTEEMRDEFLDCFKDLLEIAKPLL